MSARIENLQIIADYSSPRFTPLYNCELCQPSQPFAALLLHVLICHVPGDSYTLHVSRVGTRPRTRSLLVSGLQCVGTLPTLGPGHCVSVVNVVQYQHFLSDGNQLILAPLEESRGTTCFGIILWRVTEPAAIISSVESKNRVLTRAEL